ncbi:MAG TPA: hypothetical protein VFZ44_11120 [Pyrinomonadaceae bacterium]
MNRRVLFVITVLPAVLLLFSNSARAQANPGMREDVPPPYSDRFPRPAHDIPAPLPRRDSGRPHQSLTKEEKRLLAVAREDRATYADFLSQKRTGLIRLLPRETFDRKLALRGGGAYYSFVHREHQYGYGSDIELQGGHFSVGFAGADFGFLVDLGDTPLESVTAETDAVRSVAEFETPSAEPAAREIQQQLARSMGRHAGTSPYRRRLPAVVGHTYAVRSINYDRSDVLVAFRVLRQDENGSLLLLWKTLKEYPLPVLRSNAARR